MRTHPLASTAPAAASSALPAAVAGSTDVAPAARARA
jgi:hypothetical protein